LTRKFRLVSNIDIVLFAPQVWTLNIIKNLRAAQGRSNSNARCAPLLLAILIAIYCAGPKLSLERSAMTRPPMEGAMGEGEEETLLVAVEVIPLAIVDSVDLMVVLQTLQSCHTLIRILGI
jgi:hypothetical protein